MTSEDRLSAEWGKSVLTSYLVMSLKPNESKFVQTVAEAYAELINNMDVWGIAFPCPPGHIDLRFRVKRPLRPWTEHLEKNWMSCQMTTRKTN
jgi:hypothetical protein